MLWYLIKRKVESVNHLQKNPISYGHMELCHLGAWGSERSGGDEGRRD